jgi:uncharacterized protein (DUF2236 family)
MHGGADRKFEDFPMDVDTDDPPEDLLPLIEDVDDPVEGFFGPGSIVWRVNKENTQGFGGMTAVLLQIAHPKVGAGVDDHSDFEEDPIGRAERTREIVEALLFADLETAIEASMIVRRMHEWVEGELQEDVGPWEEGEPYAANDPDNLLWVHATMIHMELTMHEQFVEELTPAEREEYYQEIKIFGQLMGIPRDHYPETLEDFWAYYERELEETVIPTAKGTRLKESLFEGNTWFAKAMPFDAFPRLYAFLSPANMPEVTRERLDLEWSEERQARYDRMVETISRSLPYMPDVMRYNAEYRKAMERIENHSEPRIVPDPRPVASD